MDNMGQYGLWGICSAQRTTLKNEKRDHQAGTLTLRSGIAILKLEPRSTEDFSKKKQYGAIGKAPRKNLQNKYVLVLPLGCLCGDAAN